MEKSDFRIREDLVVEYLYSKKYLWLFKKVKWIEYPYWIKFESVEDAQKAIEKEVSHYKEYSLKFKMPKIGKANHCGHKMSMCGFSMKMAYNKQSYYKKDFQTVKCIDCGKTDTLILNN